jgi:predicted lipoprotein with Yx(FWY)xxD motif
MKLSIKKQRNRLGALAAVAVLALAAVGCGSDDTKTTTSDAAAVATQSTTAAQTKAAAIATKDSSLGAILAGTKNHTVYMFEADKNGKSNCTGDCAAAWPPVLTNGNPTAAPDAQSSALGTTKRDDGKMQVTYAGHPIYYFTKDTDEEDVYGNDVEAFGADWYAMTATGAKAEKSDNSSASESGGY